MAQGVGNTLTTINHTSTMNNVTTLTNTVGSRGSKRKNLLAIAKQ